MHIVYPWNVINRYATLGVYSNGEQMRHVDAADVIRYCHEEVMGELSVASFFVVLNMDMYMNLNIYLDMNSEKRVSFHLQFWGMNRIS